MAEPVRLVIWDLDETFWRGTLTEGGHTYVQETHDAVIELARRGIMSTICSKNDHDTVKRILEESGIWEYFIFPSISWEPKGPRIRAMIETVQLRPETVMLIDDNPMNLKEAVFFSPRLQTAAETIVPDLLTHPLFQGKDDGALTRLKQYKLLEKRKADEAVAKASTGGSNVEFLRTSNIRVRIEHDVEKHVDRAVELINRTNQLNFTKRRLPEDPAEARAELLAQISNFASQAGLVEVFDNYGNYGYVGFFQVLTRREVVRLHHFCFSCRTLDMGVEAWVYQALGRPALDVRGQVLSDPVNAAPVDWITAVAEDAGSADAGPSLRFSSVAARGGCVLWPLVHYLRLNASDVVSEFNTVRNGIVVRLDHSLCLRRALEGVPPEAVEAFRPLGYEPEDFRTAYFDYSGENPIWIFSNWGDSGLQVYRHKATGVTIPFATPRGPEANEQAQIALRHLDAHFEPAEYGEQEFKRTLTCMFSRVPAHGRMFVLLATETEQLESGEVRTLGRRRERNRWVADVAAAFPQVEPLRMADFIESPAEIQNSNQSHFDRKVYFRVYQHICQAAGRQVPAGRQAVSAAE